MLSDVRARRVTEVDWLTGAIVRQGKASGIPVPLHETLFGLVKGLERSWQD
jgi:2-dehydropantoate 2-reductase